MRKADFLEYVERRMVELGSPKRKVRRKIEELDLHHDFLKHTALKEHLSEEAAEARASVELGSPVTLAEDAAKEIRQSSWWGRHPVIGFILLPLIGLIPALALTGVLMWFTAVLTMKNDLWEAYFSGMRTGQTSSGQFVRLFKLGFCLQYLPLTLLPIPFAWMARRSASGLKWIVVTCLICAAQGIFFQLKMTRRGIVPAYVWDNPNWLGVLGPLLIVVANWLWLKLRLRHLAPLPDQLQSQCSQSGLMELLNRPIGQRQPQQMAGLSGAKTVASASQWVKKALRTPTYWVVTIIVAVAMFFAIAGWLKSK